MRVVLLATALTILSGGAHASSCDEDRTRARQNAASASYTLTLVDEARARGEADMSKVFGYSGLSAKRLLLDADISRLESSRCDVPTDLRSLQGRLEQYR